MKDIKERIVQLRKENDLSRLDLAKRLGINKSSITRYENGDMRPALDVMMKISEMFNVSLDWLAGYETEEESKYESIIKECIKMGVSPEKLKKFIELMKDDDE